MKKLNNDFPFLVTINIVNTMFHCIFYYRLQKKVWHLTFKPVTIQTILNFKTLIMHSFLYFNIGLYIFKFTFNCCNLLSIVERSSVKPGHQPGYLTNVIIPFSKCFPFYGG